MRFTNIVAPVFVALAGMQSVMAGPLAYGICQTDPQAATVDPPLLTPAYKNVQQVTVPKMVLKLYGHDVSRYTRLVALILHEKEVPFEYHVVDLYRGEQKKAEYGTKHPFNYVPYIDDDGYILYESRAIVYYIATKYAQQGTPLIPADLQTLGLLHQALSVETCYFNEHAGKAVVESFYNPLKGMRSDPAIVQEHLTKLSGRLDVYNKILNEQRFLVGNTISLADLIHLPLAAMLPKTGTDIIATKPNVHRWYREMEARPAWQAVKDAIYVYPLPIGQSHL